MEKFFAGEQNLLHALQHNGTVSDHQIDYSGLDDSTHTLGQLVRGEWLFLEEFLNQYVQTVADVVRHHFVELAAVIVVGLHGE